MLLASIVEGLGLATVLPVLALSMGQSAQEQPEFARQMLAFLDSYGLPTDFQSLLFFLIFALIMREVINFLTMSFVGYTIADLSNKYRWRLIRAFMNAKWSYFTNEPLGQLVHAVSSFSNAAANTFLQVAQLYALIIRTSIYAVVIVVVSGKLAFAALIAGGIIFWMLQFLVKKAKKTGYKQGLTDQKLSAYFTDIFGSMKPLKAMERHAHLHVVFNATIRRLKRLLRRVVITREALKTFQAISENLLLGLGLYFAVVYWKVSILELGVIGGLVMHILRSIGRLQRNLQNIAIGEVGHWRIREIIKNAEDHREINNGTAPPTLNDAITLKDVDFAYGSNTVFSGVNARLPAEQLTVIFGPSGAGKSTLTDLIIGLYMPDSGSILVDGVPLQEIDLRLWRRQIGYVPQELILHNGSVKMNITLGDPDLNDEDVWEALRIADADQFIRELDDGIETEIGERGLKLSGGQRQRISLARALVHRPKLIILDEVTSALDPETEEKICHQIHNLAQDITVISITHRPAWLDTADVILEVANGKVTRKRRSKKIQRKAAARVAS